MKNQRLQSALAIFTLVLLLCTACTNLSQESSSQTSQPNSQADLVGANAEKIQDNGPVEAGAIGASQVSATEYSYKYEGASSQMPDLADKSNYKEISEARVYGEVRPWQSASQTENAKYFDAKYAYWFDAEEKLISRVLLDVSKQTTKRTLTQEEAVTLAISEISLYEKNFNASKKDLEVEKSEESNTPWTVIFTARDSEGFICESYKAVIDLYGEVCLLTISQNQANATRSAFTREEALDRAKLAVRVYIANILDEKGAVDTNNVSVVSQEMHTEKGRKLYSFTLSEFAIGANTYEHSFFVGVDATSGEILYVDRCR